MKKTSYPMGQDHQLVGEWNARRTGNRKLAEAEKRFVRNLQQESNCLSGSEAAAIILKVFPLLSVLYALSALLMVQDEEAQIGREIRCYPRVKSELSKI